MGLGQTNRIKTTWFLFVVVTGLFSCAVNSKLVKTETGTDMSMIYYFKNEAVCHKKPDYTKYVKTGGAVKIKELFEVEGNFESKWENAKSVTQNLKH